MKFRSSLHPDTSSHPSCHADRFVALGSCFAETIGKRLQLGLFRTCINPLGTLYSPLALASVLERAVEGKEFRTDTFFLHQELWRHFDVHSSLASTSRDESVAAANQQLQRLRRELLRADRILLTLGSAWAYRELKTGEEVAHNHKLPLARFEKRLVSKADTVTHLERALTRLRLENPKARTLVTVSPVRHLRDGLRNNNLSKATLLLAAAELEQRLEFVDYFPAYELVIDDLRDYRFFESDLTHPTNAAIEYVWKAFTESQLTTGARDLIARADSLRSSIEHLPAHPQTQAYRDHLDRASREILQLADQKLDVSYLEEILQSRHAFL